MQLLYSIVVPVCIHRKIPQCLPAFPLLAHQYMCLFLCSSVHFVFVFSHFLHRLQYVSFSYFSLAHRCTEPQESSILLRSIRVVGRWSGAEVPLWDPLLHLQLHPDVATACGECNVHKDIHSINIHFRHAWLLFLSQTFTHYMHSNNWVFVENLVFNFTNTTNSWQLRYLNKNKMIFYLVPHSLKILRYYVQARSPSPMQWGMKNCFVLKSHVKAIWNIVYYHL